MISPLKHQHNTVGAAVLLRLRMQGNAPPAAGSTLHTAWLLQQHSQRAHAAQKQVSLQALYSRTAVHNAVHTWQYESLTGQRLDTTGCCVLSPGGHQAPKPSQTTPSHTIHEQSQQSMVRSYHGSMSGHVMAAISQAGAHATKYPPFVPAL